MEGGTSIENIVRPDSIQCDLNITEGKKDEINVNKRSLKGILIKIGLFTIIWGYFIWATYYQITKADTTIEETTCSGYGFLLIITVIINFSIVYNLTISPFFMPIFKKKIWNPSVVILKKIPYGNYLFYITILTLSIAYLVYDSWNDKRRLISFIGLIVFLLIGFLTSTKKSMIPWHTIIWGLILQFSFGLLTIRLPIGRNILNCFGNKVDKFFNYAINGSAFVYGDNLVYEQSIFAFKSLAAIYLLNFCVNILYYYGIMQKIVVSIGKFLQYVMDTTICESVNAAANIFLGMTESPLLLKPYLIHLTDSEIHSIMSSGFSAVAGTVLAAYISFGADPAHLITASIMSAPAALCYSKLVMPETQEIKATKKHIRETNVEFESVLDAASKGASEAFHLVTGIISNVIAFLSFVYFLNGILGWLGNQVGFINENEIWSLELILGKVLTPLSYIMGVPWDDCEKVAQLIGIKTMVNEFVAFKKMGEMELSPRSKVIATYSICGFSNPGSIGIMISTMTTLIPTKRAVITDKVFRAFFNGAIVCFMTACIAGILVTDL